MESAEIWYELGKTCSEMGLLDKAADAFRKAIEQNLRSGLLYIELAEIYVQQENFTNALSLYQKSLDFLVTSKDQAQVWGRIGNAYTRLNEYGKAIQAFQKADDILPGQTGIETSEEESTGNQSIAEAFLADDDTEGESAPSDEIEETDQENRDVIEDGADKPVQEGANVWNELGLVLFKVGAYDDAIDAYQKAITIDPALGYLYSNLGQVFSIQGKLVEAVQQYEKSLKLLDNRKDRSVSWTRLGDIYRQLGRAEKAEPAYLFAEVLSQTIAVYNNEYRQVKLDAICTNADAVRGMDEIGDLVQSIRIFGIIQPLLVCPGRNEPGKFTLISGRRRLEAARIAGLKEVPAIVRRATNQEILELSVSENIHHLAVTPFDLAHSYMRMANEFELSIEEISTRISRSCHSVANTMKMLEPLQAAKPAKNDEIVTCGQKIIDRSLATIQAQYSEIPDILPEGGHSVKGVESDTQNEEIAPISESSAESTPALWYLRSGNEENAAKQEEAVLPELSLLTRARQVLKSNPQIRRLWADSSNRT